MTKDLESSVPLFSKKVDSCLSNSLLERLLVLENRLSSEES